MWTLVLWRLEDCSISAELPAGRAPAVVAATVGASVNSATPATTRRSPIRPAGASHRVQVGRRRVSVPGRRRITWCSPVGVRGRAHGRAAVPMVSARCAGRARRPTRAKSIRSPRCVASVGPVPSTRPSPATGCFRCDRRTPTRAAGPTPPPGRNRIGAPAPALVLAAVSSRPVSTWAGPGQHRPGGPHPPAPQGTGSVSGPGPLGMPTAGPDVRAVAVSGPAGVARGRCPRWSVVECGVGGP